MEFAYLSDITGNPEYKNRVINIRTRLDDIEKPNGLYPNYMNPKTGKWGQRMYFYLLFLQSKLIDSLISYNSLLFTDHISLGALGDSFYEYLLKMWLQSGRTDTVARRMYDEAMDALVRNIIQTSAGGLTYASDMKYERLEHKMDHLACFAGAFSLFFVLLFSTIWTFFCSEEGSFSLFFALSWCFQPFLPFLAFTPLLLAAFYSFNSIFMFFFFSFPTITGGLFSLGATTQADDNSKTYMDIGKNLTNTCHESYIRTATRLGPEAFRFVKRLFS